MESKEFFFIYMISLGSDVRAKQHNWFQPNIQ